MIELKFDTINIIIYRQKIPKHDSVHINFCRLPQKFSYLLLFNSLLQILKFWSLAFFYVGLRIWSIGAHAVWIPR
jgi:hypothetical protein